MRFYYWEDGVKRINKYWFLPLSHRKPCWSALTGLFENQNLHCSHSIMNQINQNCGGFYEERGKKIISIKFKEGEKEAAAQMLKMSPRWPLIQQWLVNTEAHANRLQRRNQFGKTKHLSPPHPSGSMDVVCVSLNAAVLCAADMNWLF